MKKAFLRAIVLIVVIVAGGIVFNPAVPKAHAFSGNGTGINFDPYQITNCDQLQEVNDDLSAHYSLVATIDCSATSSWNSGAGFVPLGNNTTPFTGRFLAQNNVITGLYINRPGTDRLGLFGVLNGDVYQVNIKNASVSGGSNNYTGVLAGEARSSAHVVLSSAAGTVNSFWFAGGFIGKNAGLIENSYANVAVNSVASRVGGFVGDNSGTIMNSYSRGAVETSAADYGGFIGYNVGGGVVNSFWDTQTSGQSGGAGTGKTTAEMKDVATFTNTETDGLTTPWDFASNPHNDTGTSDYWTIDATRNNGYPYFVGQWYDVDESDSPDPVVFDGGNGSEQEPYRISTCEQVQGIANDLSAHYALTINVDCSMTNPDDESFDGAGLWADGNGFIPIGNDQDGEQFLGTLDGYNHSIEGLFIDRGTEDTTGLFGAVGLGSTISNLSLTNADITGDQAVGGLGGVVYGTVSNCSITGGVNGSDEVGGLVGGHNGWDTVEDSYSEANVQGGSNVGGLVGSNYGNIYRSYATGEVIGDYQVGGLVGVTNEDTTVMGTFATGHVSGMDSVGGLVGAGAGAGVENNYATGSVEGGTHLGGLIGATGFSYIDHNYATGNVTSYATGESYVGGLGGGLYFTYVFNNHATGEVAGENADDIGGLIGGGVVDIEQSYATGAVSGANYVGGLAGALNCEGAMVLRTFSTGPVTATDYAGGFAGVIGGNCNIGNVYTRSTVDSQYWAGGFAAMDTETTSMNNVYAANTVTSANNQGQDFIFSYDPEAVSISNSFFDNELSALGDGTPAVGKSTEAMKSVDTFTTELGEGSWDFETTWDIDAEVNAGYPCLLWDGGGCVEASPYTQGDGSSEAPYLINTCQQLQAMQEDLTANYALNNDVDCTNSVVWNGGRGFDPVGDDSTPFSGNLDGREYTINDLFIQRADDSYYANEGDEQYVGLFGYIQDSEIKDLNIIDSKVKGYRYVGGITGYAEDSNIHDTNFNVDLEDNSCAPGKCVWARWGEYGGGIAGYARHSTFDNVATGGPVKGSGVVIGGLVGAAVDETTITGSTSNSYIDGGYQIGGLVGALFESTLSDSTALGDVRAVYDDGFKLGTAAGGAVGYSENSAIEAVNASGSVNGWSHLGGVIGESQDSTIEDSYANGHVFAHYTSGGFVGSLYHSTVERSYSTGVVTGENYEFGGFAGSADGSTIVSSGSDSYVYGSEESSSVGGFVGGSLCGSEFTDDEAHGIVSGGDDVGGFTGFDGCEGPGSFFTESFATGDVTSAGDNAGGFAGRLLASNLLRVYASGDVDGGHDNAGGLVGYQWSWDNGENRYGITAESFATGDVTADFSEAGGFVGALEDSTIEDSYARGNVETGMRAGGFVGKAFGTADTITNSYATGETQAGMAMGGFIAEFNSYPENHQITNSFWDKEVSHQGSTSHNAGTGKTTDEMKSIATFGDAGWNLGEVWGVSPSVNEGYPCLLWANEDCTSTFVDSDGDGVADAVENSRPNAGDANNDGTLDSEQDNVVALANMLTDKIVVLELGETCEIQTAEVKDANGFTVKDSSYSYTDGMVHFTADCGTPGVTTHATQYYYDKGDTGFTVRKFNSVTSQYSTIAGASISNTVIDGHPTTRATYTITDGESLDEDATADGVIVDPAGLGTAASVRKADLASSGVNNIQLLIIGLTMISLSVPAIVWLRRKRLV